MSSFYDLKSEKIWGRGRSGGRCLRWTIPPPGQRQAATADRSRNHSRNRNDATATTTAAHGRDCNDTRRDAGARGRRRRLRRLPRPRRSTQRRTARLRSTGRPARRSDPPGRCMRRAIHTAADQTYAPDQAPGAHAGNSLSRNWLDRQFRCSREIAETGPGRGCWYRRRGAGRLAYV